MNEKQQGVILYGAILGFVILLVVLMTALVITSRQEKIRRENKLLSINQTKPSAIIKQVFVDISQNNKYSIAYNRCIVEDSTGKRYILPISSEDEKNNLIPIEGETWQIEFYDKMESKENFIPKLVKKIE